MRFNYNKLRGRIVELYGTIGKFSEVYENSETVLSKKLNNHVAFTQKEIAKLCELLQIDKCDIGDYFFTFEVQRN